VLWVKVATMPSAATGGMSLGSDEIAGPRRGRTARITSKEIL